MFKSAFKCGIVQTVLHTSSHVCVVRPAVNDSCPPLKRACLSLCALNATIEQAVRYICIITVSDNTASKPAGAHYIGRYTTVLDFVTRSTAGYSGFSYKTCCKIATLDGTSDMQVLDGAVFNIFERSIHFNSSTTIIEIDSQRMAVAVEDATESTLAIPSDTIVNRKVGSHDGVGVVVGLQGILELHPVGLVIQHHEGLAVNLHGRLVVIRHRGIAVGVRIRDVLIV